MTLNEELERLCTEASAKEGEYEAFILESLINRLVDPSKISDNDIPYEVFFQVCEFALESLKPYGADLTSSPAAPVLLQYLKSAFEKYLSQVPSRTANLSSADRYRALGNAFGIIGKQGKKLTDEKLMEICSAYSSKLSQLTNGQSEEVTPKHITESVRAAYEAHYKEPWSAEKRDDATQKFRTQLTRKLLEENGYL